MDLVITSYTEISSNTFRKDGKVLFQAGESDATAFLKAAYRHLGISYPKFFKMDNLCKLAFLAAEPLLNDRRTGERYEASAIGIILQNSSSSLTTDEKHQESVADRQNYFPSPSVFVYTLPNIMAGELAIRHKIKGENAVFIVPQPDGELMYNFVSELFISKRVDCCLAGWVEENRKGISACLFLAEKTGSYISSHKMGESIIFEPSTIDRLFKDAR